MKVEKIYIYPIKSLRGVELSTATVTRWGFEYDRRFMLLKIEQSKDGAQTYKNMAVAHFNELVRFFQEIVEPEGGRGRLKITHKPAGGGEDKIIEIPLVPDTDDLELTEVIMHRSPTKAHIMPAEFSKWFSDCLGYEAVLAYVGDHRRKVLMSTEGNRRTPAPEGTSTANGSGWLASTFTSITSATASLVGFGQSKAPDITFSDVAPFLVVSSKSMEDVNRKLNGDNKENQEHFDITKFRPNVVVSGSPEPWDEDFWGELTFAQAAPKTPDDKVVLKCESNCGRCRSINIDFNTGKQGEGEAGKMLKKLSVDRRVDAGTKYSPIFGRYSFIRRESEGRQIHVGDSVDVSVRNKERTRFDWEGLCTK